MEKALFVGFYTLAMTLILAMIGWICPVSKEEERSMNLFCRSESDLVPVLLVMVIFLIPLGILWDWLSSAQ